MGSQLVSVIIPTFNRAYCLPVTLGSLQQQTYMDWEALVIDDGSTDDTAAVVKARAACDSRIKYFYQENGGVSAARNTGLRIAQGEWIGFLDSDDAWEPWKLSAQMACFRRLPDIGMIWTDMNAFNSAGTLVSSRHLRKMYGVYALLGDRNIFQGEVGFTTFAQDIACEHEVLSTAVVRWGDLYSMMIFGSLVHTSTVLMSRRRAQAVGFFDETYRTGEDYDFHLRTCREGPVALLDVPSIRYRLAGGSDQLTASAHKVEIALNALRARESAIAHDRARIELTDAELGRVMASANAWVAEELFERFDLAAAQPYFRRGFLLARRNPKLFLKAVLSFLPPSLGVSILNIFRKNASCRHDA